MFWHGSFCDGRQNDMTEAEIITPNHPRYHGIHSPKITFDNKTHKILKWEHVRTASDRRASAAGALARAGNAYLLLVVEVLRRRHSSKRGREEGFACLTCISPGILLCSSPQLSIFLITLGFPAIDRQNQAQKFGLHFILNFKTIGSWFRWRNKH